MTLRIEKQRACVKIERIKGRGENYRLLPNTDSIGLIKEGTLVQDFTGNVYDINGNKIEPTGRFMISVETIDPYHLLIDMF